MKVLTHHFLVTVTHAHDLQDHECAVSLISCTLSGDPNSSFSSSGTSNTFYCVGTAYVYPEDPEPKTGRLILFQLLEGRKKDIIYDRVTLDSRKRTTTSSVRDLIKSFFRVLSKNRHPEMLHCSFFHQKS